MWASHALIFAGTPEFAALALRALIDAGHDIPLVLTQPDRPGRARHEAETSPVKEVAWRMASPSRNRKT
jgi:methionyl-tRNA formyltransferase